MVIKSVLAKLFLSIAIATSVLGIPLQTPIQAESDSIWTLRIPPDTPAERSHFDMAYDSNRNVTVMFGGLSLTTGILNETWELSGNTWTKRTPTHTPSSRYGLAMAYDEAHHEIVLFGGQDANYSNQTWVWNGNDWAMKTPATNPPALYFPRLTYDRARQVVVMYGGQNTYGYLQDTTWEWDGTNWTEMHPQHTPGGRFVFTMTYDASRSKVILFGGLGNTDNQTWEYDGNDWLGHNSAIAPPVDSAVTMAFDETINRSVLLTEDVEINPTLDRVWEWDGTNWTERTPAVGPSIRGITTLVYDNVRGKTILFGGASGQIDNSVQLKDTWERDGTSGLWTEIIIPNNPTGVSQSAYDSARGEIVRFGGSTATAGRPSASNETWVLGDNDTHWAQKFPQHHPPASLNSSMVYDANRSVVVLFGGITNYYGIPLYDTWEWDGTDWTQKQPSVSPPAGGVMTYDSDRGVVLLFVALGNTGETWAYDGTNWMQSFSQHSPTLSGGALVYDSRRHKAILFGDYGHPSNETWEWDGTDWTLRTLPQSPSVRGAQGMAYDAGRGVTVLFGGLGQGYMNDTWEYDGNTWTLMTPSISPQGRYSYMVYDTNRHAVELVGGGIVGGLIDDTWEYRTSNLPPTVEAGGPYSVSEGNSAIVTATGNDPEGGPLVYDWDLDNNGTFETPGQSVTFSAVGLEAPNSYPITVRATDNGGLSATDPAVVNIIYNFNGFFQPVDNLPTLNTMTAGRGVAVKFSLSGYQGLNIIATGYPTSSAVACGSTAEDAIEQTMTVGSSSLTYDASADQYIYVWKTDKPWAGTCRTLVIKLSDGTYHRANFKFK